MERLLWICLAGAVGTGARYLIALWAAQRLGSAFPHGTLIVNVIGCFAIAALMHAALGTMAQGGTVRVSVGPFNSDEHIEIATRAIGEMVST